MTGIEFTARTPCTESALQTRPVQRFGFMALLALLPLAGAIAFVSCTPPIACEDSAACPDGQYCASDGFCAEGSGDGDGDGDGDGGDGDGDGDGNGDGDGDGDGAVCPEAGQEDCDNDGQCDFLNQHPNNCGECGNVCASGVCAGGQCEAGPLIEGLSYPWTIYAEDGYVYFTEWNSFGGGTNGAVKRFEGANPMNVDQLAAGIEEPTGIVIDGPDLYFFELRYQIDDALWRTPKAGPPIDAELIVDEIDAEGSGSGPDYYGLTAAQGYVFWFDYSTLHRKGVQSSQIDEISFNFSFSGSLVTDGEWIYFERSDTVYRLAVNFSLTPAPEPQAVASIPDGHGAMRAVVAADGYLYFASNPSSAEGAIVRVATDGSTSELLIAEVNPVNDSPEDSTNALALATDGVSIYYATEGTNRRIYKAALVTGATPELLAEADAPRGIAVDDQFVYWTESTDGLIMRKTK